MTTKTTPFGETHISTEKTGLGGQSLFATVKPDNDNRPEVRLSVANHAIGSQPHAFAGFAFDLAHARALRDWLNGVVE